jgi:TrmH family RNA methyltransferase
MMSFRILQISSTQNPIIQEIRRAVTGGHPLENGLYVAEGPHLLEELLRSRWTIEKALFTPTAFSAWEDRIRQTGVETILVPEKTFAYLSGTETAQGVLALVRPRAWRWAELFEGCALVLALDGVQDPGNAGAAIRSAEAFGASGATLLRDSVRISNAKLIRAAAGSLFRLPVRDAVEPEELIREAHLAGVRLYALAARGEICLTDTDLKNPCVVIGGSEGAGVSRVVLDAATTVKISTSGVESLNVAVASSIALFEANRQRDIR